MKKLIKNEIISVVVVLMIFFLICLSMNGWNKTGQERNNIVIGATFVAAFIGAISVAFAVTAAVAFISAFAVGAFVAAVAGIDAVVAFAIVVVLFVVMGFGTGSGISIDNEFKKIPKKNIYISLTTEAISIIVPILLITFL